MIQRTINHPRNAFKPCRTCGRQPRHIVSIGRRASEPGLIYQHIERHSLECSCGTHTPLQASLDEAQLQWRGGQQSRPVILRDIHHKTGAAA